MDILQGLENIDDDADRQNIALVKTTDADFAAEMGVQVMTSHLVVSVIEYLNIVYTS